MASVNIEQPTALDLRFAALADEWKAQSALLSSSNEIANLSAYREIISLGPSVLPLILQDLQQEPAHWFEAFQV